MVNPTDGWPTNYNPGSIKHLHALGVIAVEYNALERGMAELYLIPLRRQKIADKLSDLYYFSLNAEKQLEAIKIVYKEYETDKDVVALVENIVESNGAGMSATNSYMPNTTLPCLAETLTHFS